MRQSGGQRAAGRRGHHAEPARVRATVVRRAPITPFTARICLADIEHRGVTFPAGTIVAICSERVNREQHDGEAFDSTAELEEALGFLAPRMPDLVLAGEPKLGGVQGIYGIEVLPLRWNRNAAGAPAGTAGSRGATGST